MGLSATNNYKTTIEPIKQLNAIYIENKAHAIFSCQFYQTLWRLMDQAIADCKSQPPI